MLPLLYQHIDYSSKICFNKIKYKNFFLSKSTMNKKIKITFVRAIVLLTMKSVESYKGNLAGAWTPCIPRIPEKSQKTTGATNN